MNSLTVYLNGALLPTAWLKQPEAKAALAASEFGRTLFDSQVTSEVFEKSAIPSASMFEVAIGMAHAVDARQVSALHGFLDNVTPGAWRIDPIALRLAIDHLVLASATEAQLTAVEAKALFDAIHPLFLELSGQLVQATGDRWYWEQASLKHLKAASLEAARGRNIQGYLPEGADAKQWRRLLNEIQMTWFAHEINTVRERRGALPINGVWISGPVTVPKTSPYDGYIGPDDGLAAALAKATNRVLLSPKIVSSQQGNFAYVDESLAPARQSEDFSVWLEGAAHLSKTLDPWLMQAQTQGASMRFVLTGEARLLELSWVPRKPWQFWRKPLELSVLADLGD